MGVFGGFIGSRQVCLVCAFSRRRKKEPVSGIQVHLLPKVHISVGTVKRDGTSAHQEKYFRTRLPKWELVGQLWKELLLTGWLWLSFPICQNGRSGL